MVVLSAAQVCLVKDPYRKKKSIGVACVLFKDIALCNYLKGALGRTATVYLEELKEKNARKECY